MSDTMRDRAQEHVSRMTEHGLPTGPLTDTNGWLAEALTAFAKAELERAAAPDMREALKKAHEALWQEHERRSAPTDSIEEVEFERLLSAIDAVETALSKADGEEK